MITESEFNALSFYGGKMIHVVILRGRGKRSKSGFRSSCINHIQYLGIGSLIIYALTN